jgi:hypothetical protein
MKPPAIDKLLLCPADDCEPAFLRTEFVKWFAVVAASIAVFAVFALAVGALYHPDISKALEYAGKISVSPRTPNNFAPEPMERFLFIAALFIIPAAILLFSFVLYKMNGSLLFRRSGAFYFISLGLFVCMVVGTTYSGLAAKNPFFIDPRNAYDSVAKTNWDFYFGTTFLHKHLWSYIVVIFPGILFLFLHRIPLSKKTMSVLPLIKSFVAYSFFIAFAIVVFFMAWFSFPPTYECMYDLNSVYYSVVQVFRGVPMLVNGFTNTYGLYPHFIVPLLKITGLSVGNFSFIMACLIVLCFSNVFFTLMRTVNEKILALFGFCTIVFNCFLFSKIVTDFDIYYALFPLRWLFPLLLLSYSVLYLKKPSKIMYYSSFFVFSLGILWNPDFGSVTFISLVLFYSYLELKSPSLFHIALRLFKHAGCAAGAVVITFLSYMLIIKMFYGSVPDLLSQFSTFNILALVGFSMLPMPGTVHPWMLIGLIYCIGLTYAIQAVVRKNITTRSSLVMLVTVLGIGLFSYYQGRSHNGNLPACCLPAFILLTLFSDDLYTIYKSKKVFVVPFALTLFVLSFSFFQILYDQKRICGLTWGKKDSALARQAKLHLEKNAAAIRAATQPGEKVFIFTAPYYLSQYFDLSGTCSIENPGIGELFLLSDYQRLLSRLAHNETTKVFFEPAVIENLEFDNDIPGILAALYDARRPADAGVKMLYLTKKKSLATHQEFLIKSVPGEILHIVPDNDLSEKLLWVQGMHGGLATGQTFSIEMIFKPWFPINSPLTNDPVLLTNRRDNTGFCFGRPDHAGPDYLFTTGGNGIMVPVAPAKWNYVCLERTDSTLRAFSGGSCVGTVPAGGAYRDSDGPLYLGSDRMDSGFFFGDVWELKISRARLDEKAMAETMKKVKRIE